jgi:hypothetical protein
MKMVVIVLDIVTGLMIASTVICGLWMKAQPEIDPSSIGFHMGIALLAAALVAVTLVVSTAAVFRLSA